MTKKPTTNKTNIFDVLIRIVDVIYNLLNTGNIIGVFLLFFGFEVFFITQKLTPEKLDSYLSKLFEIECFFAYPLILALITSVAANIIQKKTYLKHIDDLKETRDKLIYGLKAGDFKKLKQQHSSGISLKETKDDC